MKPDDESAVESTEEMVAEHGLHDPVAIRTVDDEPIARALAGLLIREGIPAGVQTGEGAMDGVYPTTLSRWYVFVEREHAPRALEMLETIPGILGA
jgi:hypothetical protein